MLTQPSLTKILLKRVHKSTPKYHGATRDNKADLDSGALDGSQQAWTSTIAEPYQQAWAPTIPQPFHQQWPQNPYPGHLADAGLGQNEFVDDTIPPLHPGGLTGIENHEHGPFPLQNNPYALPNDPRVPYTLPQHFGNHAIDDGDLPGPSQRPQLEDGSDNYGRKDTP
ncbi:hypothetical protein PV04_10448 [Phialophora macrospora]|uniref:Uncharacterized protein n=1 Tax=Phialophora macrospora TaxID=1851006 RepID=A0A0D2F5I9_9EURO|nr:hypothetical protein PV04_10448 [Phialophora macrospora]